MQFSFATANLYFQPFEQVLEVIAEAGFQNIELDLYWARKEWAMAQHLRDMPIKRAVQLIEQSGLRISSIHDGGGVLEDKHSAAGLINPALDEYLSEMGSAPDCLVFHTPHIEGKPEAGWWEQISDQIIRSLEDYRTACSFVCIENMPLLDGYFVPLVTPEALYDFVVQNDLRVTLDTTHYAQIETDIVEAARILGSNVKTVHLSDFKARHAHVFIEEGELDLRGFFNVIDKEGLNAVTLESSLASMDRSDHQMSYNQLVDRARIARRRIEQLLGVKNSS